MLDALQFSLEFSVMICSKKNGQKLHISKTTELAVKPS